MRPSGVMIKAPAAVDPRARYLTGIPRASMGRRPWTIPPFFLSLLFFPLPPISTTIMPFLLAAISHSFVLIHRCWFG